MPENFTAIFFHSSQSAPISMEVLSEKSFCDLCRIFPTDWAHLMDTRTGEILYSWSSDNVSWKNN